MVVDVCNAHSCDMAGLALFMTRLLVAVDLSNSHMHCAGTAEIRLTKVDINQSFSTSV